MKFSMYSIICSLFFALMATGCGGDKSKSDLAKVNITPEKPIVITGDTVDDSGTSITSPWFEFRVAMSNGSNQPITIVAITAEVYGQTSAGMTEKKEVAFTPSQFNFQLNETTQCKYTSFGTWDAGAAMTGLTLQNGVAACKRTPRFLIGGNTKGVSGSNYRYRVKIRPVGWFGTESDAIDRFDKYVTVFTQ